MSKDNNIQEFLDSGLLEQYLVDAIDDHNRIYVEEMIEKHHEVRNTYDQLQEDLELFAQINGTNPPEGLEDCILKNLDQKTATSSTTNWLNIAAMIITIFALSGFIYLYQVNNTLKKEMVETVSDYESLERTYELTESQKVILSERLAFIESADTDKYLLRGYIKNEPLRVIAYHNAPQGKAQIEIAALPELDDQNNYQLWADVNGEMISLAIIDDLLPKTISVATLKKATDLNITIEKAGGSKHASVENLVATIPLRVER